jgi:glycosyl transferase, family 25
MKTFVINLKSSPDRREFMKNQVAALGLDFEFIEAVDGRRLSESEMREKCDMDQVKAWPDLLTPAMIGCSLSHHRVYQEIVSRKIPFALVLEDDTLLSKNILRIVTKIGNDLTTDKLDRRVPILLYYQSKEKVEFSRNALYHLDDEHNLYYPLDLWRPITTAAYIITLECAQKLVELVYPVKYSPDSWAVFYREQAIAGIMCVLPLPVQSGFFKSDIGYELHKPLNKVIKYLEAKNVFPVKQLLKLRRRRIAIRSNAYSIVDKPLNWNLQSRK